MTTMNEAREAYWKRQQQARDELRAMLLDRERGLHNLRGEPIRGIRHKLELRIGPEWHREQGPSREWARNTINWLEGEVEVLRELLPVIPETVLAARLPRLIPWMEAIDGALVEASDALVQAEMDEREAKENRWPENREWGQVAYSWGRVLLLAGDLWGNLAQTRLSAPDAPVDKMEREDVIEMLRAVTKARPDLGEQTEEAVTALDNGDVEEAWLTLERLTTAFREGRLER